MCGGVGRRQYQLVCRPPWVEYQLVRGLSTSSSVAGIVGMPLCGCPLRGQIGVRSMLPRPFPVWVSCRAPPVCGVVAPLSFGVCLVTTCDGCRRLSLAPACRQCGPEPSPVTAGLLGCQWTALRLAIQPRGACTYPGHTRTCYVFATIEPQFYPCACAYGRSTS